MDEEKIYDNLNGIEKNIVDISSLTELTLATPDVEKIDGEDYYATMKTFLDSQLGSREDLEMKKLMALSAIAAGAEASVEELASQVDSGAVSAKTAYKVSTGELDIIEATDVIIDCGEARLNTFIQSNLDIDVAGEAISACICCAFPKAKVAKPFIKAIVRMAEPAVRSCISAGLKTVAGYAKQAVRSVVSGIKSFAKSLLKA